MSTDNTSLAVWDVPMPAVAGETFSIKVGAKGGLERVEVIDSAGVVVASGALGDAPWPRTEALRWTALDLPAPKAEVSRYIVRCGAAETWFSVVAAPKPEHTLTVQITERDTKETLAGVEIRLGPFHARTDKAGRAEVGVSKGEYQLQLWRNAYIAPPRAVSIAGDTSLALTMVNVPEEHPDARWVR